MAKKKPAQETREDQYRAYECLGLDLTQESSTEFKATCFYCSHNALHIQSSEGLYHCKHCGESGNKYTFLQAYYENWQSQTTAAHYAALSKDRSLPPQAFELCDLAYDSDQKIWIIPVKNEKDSMVNLGRYATLPTHPIYSFMEGEGKPVLGVTTCKTHLFNLHTIGESENVYICEGPWDWIALDYLLRENKVDDAVVLAAPGANVFKDEWAKYLEKKRVYLLYDNDKPGKGGMIRVTQILQKTKLKSFKQIAWPESFPNKFDIRDFVIKNLVRPKKAWMELNRFLAEVPTSVGSTKYADIKRETFDELMQDFKGKIKLNEDIKDTMTVILAVMLSNYLFVKNPYNPLWLFVVAPSSGGKTMLLQTASDFEGTNFQSSLTSKTLVSGYRKEGGSDVSLLPFLIRKSLIIEEFTTILKLPASEQDEIFSIFRAVYNGRYEKTFGSVGARVYPEPGSEFSTCHFAILAGTTGAIHGNRSADLGERFLKWIIPCEYDTYEDKIRSGIDNTIEGKTPEEELRPFVCAFLDHKKNNLPTEAALVPEEIKDRLVALAQIVSIIRAVVQRKGGDLLVRPEAEVGVRLGQQFVKFCQAIAFVHDKYSVDEKCYSIVQKLAMDTCYGWHRDAIYALRHFGEEGASIEEVSQKAIISRTTCHKVLEDLFELGAVDYTLEQQSKGRGRPRYSWTMTTFMRQLFSAAKFEEIHSTKLRKKRHVARKGVTAKA